MKKLFVLFLCLAAVAGLVFAGTVHPPGVLTLETPGYVVDYADVAPDTVLVMETLTFPDQILAVPDILESGLSVSFIVTVVDPGLPDVVAAGVDYPLRL
jgi:hypothetical protein